MRNSIYSSAAKLLAAATLTATVAACSETTSPVPSSNASIAHRSFDRTPSPGPVAVFVIGDSEPSDIGATVNFWGAQWWQNNQMTDTVSSGVARFKGFATTSDNSCGGAWQSRPGNSYDPPATIDGDIAVIVTSNVIKDGASIRGDIKRIVMVHQDGGYGPNPGHPGNGVITSVVCDNNGGGIL